MATGLSGLLAKAKTVAKAQATSTVKQTASKAGLPMTLDPAAVVKAAEEKAKTKALEEAAKQAGMSADTIKSAEGLASKFGGVTAAMATVSTFFTQTIPNSFTTHTKIWAFVGFIVLLGIAFAIWQFYKKKPTTSPADAQSQIAPKTAGAEGFQDSTAIPVVTPAPPTEGVITEGPPPTEELTLINALPLTIKQAGYLGPPEGGKFDPAAATGSALKAGFRSFVLQIDYLKAEKDMANFPAVGTPTLLYRDNAGKLISANAGSIEEVTKTIAALAFRPESPSYMMPVILYLHVTQAPSAVREPEKHLRFLSLIARALNPLAPFHLGSTPMGTFHRQKGEATLLTTPLKAIEGQVVIMSNVDTTLFRQPLAGGKRFDPADDLDYWVNMRVYLASEDDAPQGLAKVAEKDDGAHAIVTNLSDLLSLSTTKKDAFATKGKGRFVIAMASAMANPTVKELDAARNELGVNMVPIDLYDGDLAATKLLIEEYSNKTYSSKPAALRLR